MFSSLHSGECPFNPGHLFGFIAIQLCILYICGNLETMLNTDFPEHTFLSLLHAFLFTVEPRDWYSKDIYFIYTRDHFKIFY